jgi:NAD(P)-dependent dehydrogenase (short-subunit alcohol dehydrogenase family)
LINNAGITSPTRFLDVTGEEWDRIFAVNVRGSYNLTRRVAPVMVDRGFGRIVFVSSVSAERGGGLFVAVPYSAAKAAELGFARALAPELGPNGATVNSVAPASSKPTSAEGCLPASARATRRPDPGRPRQPRQ